MQQEVASTWSQHCMTGHSSCIACQIKNSASGLTFRGRSTLAVFWRAILCTTATMSLTRTISAWQRRCRGCDRLGWQSRHRGGLCCSQPYARFLWRLSAHLLGAMNTRRLRGTPTGRQRLENSTVCWNLVAMADCCRGVAQPLCLYFRPACIPVPHTLNTA